MSRSVIRPARPSRDDTTAMLDLMCEVYRQFLNVPDEVEVDVKVGLFESGTVQLTMKCADVRVKWSDQW